MRKVLLIISIIFLLTGCQKNNSNKVNTIDYNLNISKYYKEEINFNLTADARKKAEYLINVDAPINAEFYALLNDSMPIFSNVNAKYNREVKELKDMIKAKLSYNYIEKDFTYSNLIRKCFENYNIYNTTDYLELDLSGKFTCLDDDKKLNINVTTNLKAESNGNIDKNSYSWNINQDNKDNVNIKIKIYRKDYIMYDSYDEINTKKKSINSNLIALIIIIILAIGAIIGVNILKKKFNEY